MPTYNYVERTPARELLAGVARLIRVGVPPLLEAPAWAEGTAAPAGHWLCPVGTKIFTYEKAAEVTSPGVMIEQSARALRETPNTRIFWRIPLQVTLLLARDPGADGILALEGKLLRLLAERLPTGNPATEQPWDRLSAASRAAMEAEGKLEWAQVMPDGLLEVEPMEMEAVKAGHAAVRVVMVVKCGTATARPAAA